MFASLSDALSTAYAEATSTAHGPVSIAGRGRLSLLPSPLFVSGSRFNYWVVGTWAPWTTLGELRVVQLRVLP